MTAALSVIDEVSSVLALQSLQKTTALTEAYPKNAFEERIAFVNYMDFLNTHLYSPQ